MKEKIHVSDVIGDDFRQWKPGDNIILNCATGTGKTTFIETVLHKYCYGRNKKILYLCNRSELKSKVWNSKKDNKLKSIYVESYQYIEHKVSKGEPLAHLEGFDYVVCDEFHYMLLDSTFNPYVNLSLEWIRSQSQAVVIHMSATADSIFDAMKSNGLTKPEHEYIIEPDYSYVEELQFYRKSDLRPIIDDILNNSDKKIIYFCNSKERAKELYAEYEPVANFKCSNYTNSREDVKLLKKNKDCISKHGEDDETGEDIIAFDKRMLITTKVLDNGIDIKDRKVKHIIADILDLDSLQQCLGRKRVLDEDDTCRFYIRNYTANELNLFIQSIRRQSDPANLYDKDRSGYVKKYGHLRSLSSSAMYINNFSGNIEVNHVMLLKCERDIATFKAMQNEGIYGYSKEIIRRFNIDMDRVIYSEDVAGKSKLMTLEEHLGVMEGELLNKDQQSCLVEYIGLRDSRNRLQKGLNLINEYLKSNKVDFTIISKRDYRRKLENGDVNPMRNKVFWQIVKTKLD